MMRMEVSTMGRKRRSVIFLLCILLCLALTGSGLGEIDLAVTEWSWQSGSVSSLNGTAQSDLIGEKLTLSVRIEADPAADEESRAVFVSAGGKKITVRNQSNEIEWTPTGEAFPFEISWHLSETSASPLSAVATVSLLREDSTQVEQKQLQIDHDQYGENAGNQIVITADPWKIAMWIALAALLIWGAVIIRIIIIRKQERK